MPLAEQENPMRTTLICLLVFGAAACERRSNANRPAQNAPTVQRLPTHLRQGDDDRKPTQALSVLVNGKPVAAWTPDQLDATPVVDLTNKNGEARQGWLLSDLSAKFVGAGARVTAVLGAGGERYDIDAAKWQDPTRFLVLKVSHKGDYKLHWAARDGSADDAIVKGVREIDLNLEP
jgi:hypothetical protein